MPGPTDRNEEPRSRRLRAGLRRHGLAPRPSPVVRLLRPGDVRFTSGNAVRFFADGASGLAAMEAAIEAAAETIHLETYILRADATGRRFLDLLTRRARAGVEVRLLFDGIGSRGLDAGLLAALRAAGGDVVVFNPLRRIYPRWAPRRRDHRKILVVDGEVAFTGGLNVGDEYRRGTGPVEGSAPAWQDAHVRVVGPAVALLEAVFLESWFRADGPDLPWPSVLHTDLEVAGGQRVGVLPDGPTYRRRRVRDLMIAALERARDRVTIATPYFAPGVRLRAALGAAARRGVRVEMLLAGYTDHPLLRWGARGLVARLVPLGVRVYEVEHAMMHAKVAVFDGSWALMGTSNLDRQSLQHSYEVNLVFDGGSAPGRLFAMIEAQMQAARPLTAAELEARPFLERVRDWLAARLLTRL